MRLRSGSLCRVPGYAVLFSDVLVDITNWLSRIGIIKAIPGRREAHRRGDSGRMLACRERPHDPVPSP